MEAGKTKVISVLDENKPGVLLSFPTCLGDETLTLKASPSVPPNRRTLPA
jgi:hypothetical protein